MEPNIHPLAEVKSSTIGGGTTVWQFVVVAEGAEIGENCHICSHVFIEGKVKIGKGVTVKNGAMLYDGVTIGDGCFIGPCVAFTNDVYPRSKGVLERADYISRTVVQEGVSIGANATIRAGITIGRYAMIGAGAVVTKDVPPFALVVSNPGRVAGQVDKAGLVVSRSD